MRVVPPRSSPTDATDSGNGSPPVQMRGVAVSYDAAGKAHEAVTDIDLDVRAGEFMSIIGPSGCGKSTLLGVLSGLMPPTAGTAQIAGEPVTGIPDGLAYLFQQDALLPWKTVEGNVALGLKLQDGNARLRQDQQELVADWIHRVGLAGFGRSYPHQLSGGMRKRAALAQALVGRPRVLLMDEPFGALDVQTRTLMEQELLQLWEEVGATVIFVTHDLEEAILLSDRVSLMTAGPSSTIKSTYEVPLARPRRLDELKYEDDFAALNRRIWADLRDEVMRVYESPRTAS